MKDATKYANDIAKKENDDALEAVRKSGKTEIITLTPEQKAADEEGAVCRAQGERVARRQGHDRRGLQGNRLQAVEVSGAPDTTRSRARHSQNSAVV